MSGGPVDPEARRLWRLARREVARAHHPDLGGEPDVFIEKLQEVDQHFTTGLASRAPAESSRLTIRAGRTMRRGRRRLRHRARRVRSVLPSRIPGSRRYFDL